MRTKCFKALLTLVLLAALPLCFASALAEFSFTQGMGATSATLATPVPATASMTDFERRLVELGLSLIPYDHPFVIAYEMTYGVDIPSYVAQVNGVTVSGIPFEYGGHGTIDGFSDRWWTRTAVGEYPVGGMDCAEFIVWIYHQLGYTLPDNSATLFLSGQSGVLRRLPGIRAHFVIPALEYAMIGDVAYNSEDFSYSSGHGSHVQMYFGTADKLGITEALRTMYPDFPGDAHLVLECGWSDGRYYYNMMRKLKVRSARTSMAGSGIQFFTSIKSGDEYIYEKPDKTFKWTNPDTGHTFRIDSRLQAQGRRLQYKPKSKADYIMNLCRPVIRPDVQQYIIYP